MKKEDLKDMIIENKDDCLDLFIDHYFKAEKAKYELREIGIGWTGLDILETVQEAISEIKYLKKISGES